jgi:thioredoxin 2
MRIICPHCRGRNRVPDAHIQRDPLCGNCRQPLLSGEVLELGEADFDLIVGGSELPVLVDFWAPWSGPSRMMASQMSQAAKQLKGRALLVKVNSDSNPRLAQRLGIRSIPTLTQMRAGHEVQRICGALQTPQILDWIQ